MTAGNKAALLPTLDRRRSLAQSICKSSQATKGYDDTQGGRIGSGFTLPDDRGHTHIYATCVEAVNVERVSALPHIAGMAKNIVSIGIQLRKLVDRSGRSMQALAQAMGYANASSIQRYLAPEYGETGALPIRIAAKFAEALTGTGSPPIDAQEIFSLAGVEITDRGHLRAADLNGVFQLGLQPTVASWVGKTTTPVDVPVYGSALGANIIFQSSDNGNIEVEPNIVELTDVIEYIKRPPSLLQRRDIYALIIAGDSMSPRYEAGDIVLVDPRRPPSSGSDVIVQLISDGEGDEAGRTVAALIKRLVRRSASFVELEQFNPAMRFKIPASQLRSIHRIVPMGEILGV